MFRLTVRIARDLLVWPVASQHAACRNALVAGTALTQRRREREEVEAFLARHLAARAAGSSTVEVQARRA